MKRRAKLELFYKYEKFYNPRNGMVTTFEVKQKIDETFRFHLKQ
jgi:hypothetical protein